MPESKFDFYFYKYRVLFSMLLAAIGIVSAYFDPWLVRSFFNLTLGITIAVLAVSIRIWASSYDWQNIASDKPQAETGLLTAGPYTYTRNPIYLGGILMTVALNLGLGSPLAFFTMTLPTILLHIWQAKHEEKFLALNAKTTFEKYKRKVPMFIPSPWKKYDKPQGTFNLKKGIKHDIGPTSGVLIFIAILVIFAKGLEFNPWQAGILLGASVLLSFIMIFIAQKFID